jgi:protein-tyrosine phosphatase
VHCSAGKDRTGMLVAIILDAVGVLRTAIAEDYAASEPAMRAMDAARPRDGAEARGMRRPWIRSARPETILETLEHLDSQYGGSANYLRSNGVTGAQLQTLRVRLVPARAEWSEVRLDDQVTSVGWADRRPR